jgi:alanine racemase
LALKIASDSDFEELLSLYSLPKLLFEGIFTHFSVADDRSPAGVEYTRAQFGEFVHICERLERSGIDVGIRHCCNSAATINFPEMHLDMVRSGILLYGLTCKGFNLKNLDDFKPVMTLKSRITSIKEVVSGEYVSYGNTYMTNQKSLIGVVSVGYADGLRRNLSNNISVFVKGQLVPGIGNICMDQMMIDLSNTKGVSIGDEVIVFGDNGACNANVMAEKLGTINWEIVCGVGKRVPRVHLIVCNAGEKAAKVYLKSED